MKALVKIHIPETLPPSYDKVIPETSWGNWIRSHIAKYVAMGWTLIDNYEPIEELPIL